MSALIPLIEAGFVDWIVSTGANLYHDTHFGLGLEMHRGNPQSRDVVLREEGVIRIYDIFFDYDVLLSTDAFFREIIAAPEFQRPMSTAEFHYLVGKYVAERERVLGGRARSRCWPPPTAAACRSTPRRPATSSIGMNVAAHGARREQAALDPNADVNETAAIVLDAKRERAARAASSSSAAARPRTSSCRPSRRSRKCSASTRRGTTTSCR